MCVLVNTPCLDALSDAGIVHTCEHPRTRVYIRYWMDTHVFSHKANLGNKDDSTPYVWLCDCGKDLKLLELSGDRRPAQYALVGV